MSHVVLVGMSVREVEAGERLQRVADRVGSASIAFLQMGEPSLHSELTRLADADHREITLVGVSLGTMAPATSWLRRIASHWWRERTAATRPTVSVATAMMRTDLDLDLVLDVTRPITGTEAPLASAAWEQVPGHRHQVLVCRGPRCTALGSDTTAEALARELVRLEQGDDDVLVTQTGCQFPCNHAPVVSVQPDDVWYGRVTPEVVRRIAGSHLVEHRPLDSHRLPRTTHQLTDHDLAQDLDTQEKAHD
ncbi:(2Fe-2S) ferredoxin [Nocardioides daedukensis]|uniref:(2Fe-2S) ferredoxin n=1 Tax=Nocardioides daedukensis TaxID=634462 RepID=A0A7Y9S142_9ACTN|nr:(2Fe-2S) ferredoxin domain-containing protein [Nocardioides daedukensis]NYG60366.1 (2Fe-2S) ferredoxin [Nocardioides daedukensis]